VASAADVPAVVSSPLDVLMEAVRTVPGVTKVAAYMGEVEIHTDLASLTNVMLQLRDDPRFAFEQMMDLAGVDWPEREQRFDVVYNLLSVSLNQRVRVVVATDAATPVPSVHGIWPVATWWEREAWDLFGIVFSGQPDLRRILTDYGFDGHPLRKDFPLTGYVEVRYDEERKQVIYEPVKLTQDFRNFDFLSPWEAMTSLPGDEKAHAGEALLPGMKPDMKKVAAP
jgi:NADH-quinone oxidoreductase subunit C